MRMAKGFRRITQGGILSAGLTEVFGRGEKNTCCPGITSATGAREMDARLLRTGLCKAAMVLEPTHRGEYRVDPPDVSGWCLDP